MIKTVELLCDITIVTNQLLSLTNIHKVFTFLIAFPTIDVVDFRLIPLPFFALALALLLSTGGCGVTYQ